MCVCLRMSEGLHYNRIQQGHVFSSSDWQLVCSVVVDDLRDGGERGAVLPQNITSVFTLSELHMHEALTAPEGEGVVIPAGLAVPHQIGALLAQSQQ